MSHFAEFYMPAHMPRAWRREVVTNDKLCQFFKIARNVGLPEDYGQPCEGLCFFDATGTMRIYVLHFPHTRLSLEIHINKNSCGLCTNAQPFPAPEWYMIMAGVLGDIRGEELDTVGASPVPFYCKKRIGNFGWYRRAA